MRGNFTDSHRETSHLVELNAEYQKQTEEFKKLAESRKKNMSYSQEDLTVFYDKMWAYVENSEVITISGVVLAMGINPRAFSRMRSGEFDYRLEQYCAEHDISQAQWQYDSRDIPYIIDNNGNRVLMIDYGELIEMFMLLYQDQAEKQVLSNKPVGGIFCLKAQFQWNDKSEEQTVPKEQIIIADSEQAKKALDLLR